MATRRYFAGILQDANGQWSVTILRDPTTEPVDVTAASPATISARVPIVETRGIGFNGPNASGAHTPTTTTAASNAAPIVVTMSATAASLGMVAGDQVYIKGVLGNLNANGTFELTSVSGSTVTLKGSQGTAAYTSGGYIRKLNKADNLQEALSALEVALANDKAANG